MKPLEAKDRMDSDRICATLYRIDETHRRLPAFVVELNVTREELLEALVKRDNADGDSK